MDHTADVEISTRVALDFFGGQALHTQRCFKRCSPDRAAATRYDHVIEGFTGTKQVERHFITVTRCDGQVVLCLCFKANGGNCDAVGANREVCKALLSEAVRSGAAL